MAMQCSGGGSLRRRATLRGREEQSCYRLLFLTLPLTPSEATTLACSAERGGYVPALDSARRLHRDRVGRSLHAWRVFLSKSTAGRTS